MLPHLAVFAEALADLMVDIEKARLGDSTLSTYYSPEFTEDVSNFCKVALAHKAPQTEVASIVTILGGLLNPRSTSRFAKALRLFPAGRCIANQVQRETLAINEVWGKAIQVSAALVLEFPTLSRSIFRKV
jgi:hypothetical protein